MVSNRLGSSIFLVDVEGFISTGTTLLDFLTSLTELVDDLFDKKRVLLDREAGREG